MSPDRAEDAGWRRLAAVLDARLAAGRPADFWWRDDDAVAASPALDRLLELAASRPVALAVIPAALEPSLVARLDAEPAVAVLQHGWAHADHAPSGERKAEFGAHRPIAVREAELTAGRDRLAAAFGSRFLPVLVPPWNRIAPDLLPSLGPLGYAAWSADKVRPMDAAAGIPALHAGVDPVDWRGSGGFAGEAAVLERLCDALQAEAPVGLLTHHRVTDAAGWRFLARLLPRLAAHPGIAWRSPVSLLPSGNRR